MKFLIPLLSLFIMFQSTLRAEEIKVSVAASMTNVLTELKDEYLKKHKNSAISLNFASSGALAKQIDKGADVDIFISANPKWMTFLEKQNKMYSKSVGVLAYNSLVFVGQNNKIKKPSQLTSLSKIGMGSPDSVPAGDYARTALTKLKLYDKLSADKKLVFASNVRQALFYADNATVDGSFVYKTDALVSQKSKILFTVSPKLYPKVTYLSGITLTGKDKKEAMSFMKFLKTGKAKKILKKYGFN